MGGVFGDAGCLVEDVVFGDEVACAGMEGASEEGACD